MPEPFRIVERTYVRANVCSGEQVFASGGGGVTPPRGHYRYTSSLYLIEMVARVTGCAYGVENEGGTVKKQHQCPVPAGYECIRGSLWNDDVRVARPLCNCGCHLPPGTRKKP